MYYRTKTNSKGITRYEAVDKDKDSLTVKPQTVRREAFVIKRLGEIIGDDYLLERLTPLLMKKCLSTYREKSIR